jgi:prevent-host-death family protein
METLRSITSTEVKANLGEILASLQAGGPVEITRNGRKIAILSAPVSDSPTAGRRHLPELAKLYSGGTMSWHEVEQSAGVTFGDLLLELSRQGLPLPLTKAAKRPAQEVLFQDILRQAARS